MGFYTSPSFFIALITAAVPAAVMGLMERRIKYYGFAASCAMLVMLFSGSPRGAAAFALFLAVAFLGMRATLVSWRGGEKSLAVYRCSLAATIAPLVIYKIGAVFDANLLGFIGISYLTFKAVLVLIEIRDGLIEDLGVIDYLYFLTFFATFTSGPIDRSRRFREDADRVIPRGEYVDMLTRGVLFLLAGAVSQLVLATVAQTALDPAPASQLAGLPAVASIPGPPAVRAIARAYVYALYLFFDFAGYSLMAVGASYCFGIATPGNFRAPYLAVDMKDFWNRWHITLSTWLRDFVFMRFVRMATKRKLFANRLHTACAAYMVDMLLMGAWHGLTVDYLAYGLYHGALLAATEAYQKRSSFHKRNKKKRWYRMLSWFITMQLVVIGFALFSGQVAHVLERIING